MIQSFADNATQQLWETGKSRKLDPRIINSALNKLRALHLAAEVNDLRIPPANRLEALKGNRKGQHSIRINQQWRVCFTWTTGGPKNVEICDYH